MSERKMIEEQAVEAPFTVAYEIWRAMSELPIGWPARECIVTPPKRCTRGCPYMKLRVGDSSITPVCTKFDPEVAIDAPVPLPRVKRGGEGQPGEAEARRGGMKG